jgi:alpha-L-fucosidase 2
LGAIQLLPALPKAWSEGSVRGLKARGGFIVDMEWSEGLLTSASVTSTHGRICRISYSVPFVVRREDGGVVMTDDHGSFETVSGATYRITPATDEASVNTNGLNKAFFELNEI